MNSNPSYTRIMLIYYNYGSSIQQTTVYVYYQCQSTCGISTPDVTIGGVDYFFTANSQPSTGNNTFHNFKRLAYASLTNSYTIDLHEVTQYL
jgi:hypothetical protein